MQLNVLNDLAKAKRRWTEKIAVSTITAPMPANPFSQQPSVKSRIGFFSNPQFNLRGFAARNMRMAYSQKDLTSLGALLDKGPLNVSTSANLMKKLSAEKATSISHQPMDNLALVYLRFEFGLAARPTGQFCQAYFQALQSRPPQG